MDASLKILTVLAESAVDTMTAGQLVEATGLSLSAVNAHIAKMTERRIISYSGDVVTAGRYAKQYSITDYGSQIMESGHAELMMTNATTAYIPEQMLKVFADAMEDIATKVAFRVENMLADLNKRANEVAAMNAESIALARLSTVTTIQIEVPAVAKKTRRAIDNPDGEQIIGSPNSPTAKSKDESPLWSLNTYLTLEEDFTPIVDKLTSEAIKNRWVKRRLVEYNVPSVEELRDQHPDAFNKALEIIKAAMAKHGWEITE